MSKAAIDPASALGDQFLAAVREGDANQVRQMVQTNPGIIWGDFTRQLSSGDLKWIFGILP